MQKESGEKPNSPRWPTIEEQLAASKVQSGTALEKLIRANQDFAMLHPAEANDRFPAPLWLRVLWRKNHPEIDLSGPRPAYPLALKEAHSWMRRHQDLGGPAQEDPTKEKK
jgi:hypothetical protein